MKVIIINWRDIKNPRAGGAETYLHEIATRWVASGIQVVQLAAGFSGAKPVEEIDGIRVIRLGNRGSVYFVVALRLLFGLARNADAIVDAENGIPFFAPLFSRKRTVLLMFHVHKRVFESQLPYLVAAVFKFIESRLMPLVYKNAQWVAISQSTASEIDEEFRPRPARLTIVQSGLNMVGKECQKSAQPSLVYLGRLQPYKRIHLLLESVQRLLTRFEDLTLTIAGVGDSLPALRLLVDELGISKSVIFSGYVSESDKVRLLGEAWCFVTPSSMEGWGIAVLEANSCGTPAVAYDVPGLRDAIVDGVTGYLVKEGDPMDSQISRVLESVETRRELEMKAESYARAFSWDKTAQEFLNATFPDLRPADVMS